MMREDELEGGEEGYVEIGDEMAAEIDSVLQAFNALDRVQRLFGWSRLLLLAILQLRASPSSPSYVSFFHSPSIGSGGKNNKWQTPQATYLHNGLISTRKTGAALSLLSRTRLFALHTNIAVS